MSFSLTDEQIMIQTMAREFSRKVVALTAAERDQTKEFPSENLKKMGELGLMGMMVPFEYEGSGADTVSYVLALSEIAYSCASTAVVMSVHNSIVCESIYRLGSEEQKEKAGPQSWPLPTSRCLTVRHSRHHLVFQQQADEWR